MRTLPVTLLDNESSSDLTGVVALRAEDASGGFTILPGHIALLTILTPGLVRLGYENDEQEFVGQPGSLLRVEAGSVTLTSRRLFRGKDADAVLELMRHQLADEESRLRSTRATLKHMEDEILRRIFEMDRLPVEGRQS